MSQLSISLESRRLLLSICLSALTIPFFLRMPLRADTWIYRTEGRRILETRSIPTHASMSFKEASPATEWVSLSWLSSVLLAMMLELGTPYATVLALIPILTASMYLALSLSGVRRNFWLAAGILCLFVLCLQATYALHPLMFVPLLILLIAELFAYERHTRPALWRTALGLSLLGALYANLAGTYLLIYYLAIVCLIAAALLQQPSKHRALRSILLLLYGFGSTCLHPSGLMVFAHSVTVGALFGANKWFSSLAGTLTAGFSNFVKQDIIVYPYVLFAILLFGCVALYVRSFLLQSHSTRLMLLPFLLLSLGGVFWVRLIPLAALTLAVFALALTQRTIQARSSKMIGGALLTLFVLLQWIAPPTPLSISYPTRHLEILSQLELPAQIATTPEYSGMVAWATYPRRANIDALDRVFDEHETIQVYSMVNTTPSRAVEQFFERNEVRTVLTSTQTEYLLVQLSSDPDWVLLYIDEAAALFARKSGLPQDVVAQHALTTLRFDRSLGFDPTTSMQAITQLEQFLVKYPDNTYIKGQLATIYRLIAKPERAVEIIHSVPTAKRTFSLLVELGRAQAASGQCSQAQTAYQHALQLRSEKNVSRAVLDLAVLYAGCLFDKERATHYFKRYNSYPLPPQERERVRQLAKQFGIALEEADTDGR